MTEHVMKLHGNDISEHMTVKMAEEKEECLALIKKIDSKQTTKVLHSLVDGICKRGHPNYQSYSDVWTLQEWWDLSDCYEKLLKSAVRDTWTKDQILKATDVLPDSHKSAIIDVVNSRRTDIHQQLESDTNKISQAVLSDFDWKVKLAMSSDKISSIQEPLLTLDLDVESDQQSALHSLELNRDELKKLISSLEGANKHIKPEKMFCVIICQEFYKHKPRKKVRLFNSGKHRGAK